MVVHLTRTKRVSGQLVPRDVLFADYRVEDFLAELLLACNPAPTDYVVESPADPPRAWDASNSSKVVRDLYDEAATATGVSELSEHGLHLWRRSRDTMMIIAGMDIEPAPRNSATARLSRQSTTPTTHN